MYLVATQVAQDLEELAAASAAAASPSPSRASLQRSGGSPPSAAGAAAAIDRSWSHVNRLLAEAGFGAIAVVPLQDLQAAGLTGEVLTFLESVYLAVQSVVGQYHQRNRLAEGLIVASDAARQRQVLFVSYLLSAVMC